MRAPCNRMATIKNLATVIAFIALSASCAERKTAIEPPAAPVAAAPSAAPEATEPAPVASTPSVAAPAAPEPQSSGRIYRETGIASWYGKESHGRKTASGEVFDMNGMSAAHRTLPLGARIRVTNLENYKSVIVTVSDRGPFVKTRIIELSFGAARELGFVAQGTATVKIESLEPVDGGAQFTVQAAVFTEEESARMLKDRLSKKFEQVAIVPFETGLGKLFRVRIGSYNSEERAELVASKLKLDGMEPFILRKD